MPNSSQSESPKRFYKYMSADRALEVLSNSTLRWSSPTLFNDPFDVPRELSHGITSDAIREAVASRVAALIENPPDDLSDIEPKLRTLLKTVKDGISPEIKAKMIAAAQTFEVTEGLKDSGLGELRELWRLMLPDLRILCLAEAPNHMAMWHHYADKYQGVVLELRCIEELDSAWRAAQRVRYPIEKPDIYTAKGWARLVTMPTHMASSELLDVATFTKAPDWEYEREWRITSFRRPTDSGNFTDYRFDVRELGGVYLGPLMKSPAIGEIRSAASKYPDLSIYQTSIGFDRELHFSPA